MRPEETFVRSVVDALQEHGQAATQFVTAHLDRDVAGVPDIVFSPNEPEGRVVCVEVRQSSVPISGVSFDRVLQHRQAIVEANPGVVYALATDAKLVGPAAKAALSGVLTVLPVDWDDPAGLAFGIEVLSMPPARPTMYRDQESLFRAMADPSITMLAVSALVPLTRRQVEGWSVIYGEQVDGERATLLVRRGYPT